MNFGSWSREIAGWLLVLLGLAAFAAGYALLLDKKVIQAPVIVFVGFVVFRGGIHLLKVAVAVRLAALSSHPVPTKSRIPIWSPSRPVSPTPSWSVIPGPRPARGTMGTQDGAGERP